MLQELLCYKQNKLKTSCKSFSTHVVSREYQAKLLDANHLTLLFSSRETALCVCLMMSPLDSFNLWPLSWIISAAWGLKLFPLINEMISASCFDRCAVWTQNFVYFYFFVAEGCSWMSYDVLSFFLEGFITGINYIDMKASSDKDHWVKK